MIEKPILFSGLMVKSILLGKKTMTRRIAKFPKCVEDSEILSRFPNQDGCPYGTVGDRLWVRETWRTAISLDDKSPSQIAAAALDAHYRKPWAPIKYEADGETDNADVLKDFGGEWGKTRVSIHMPYWAYRITLEIIGVRVERLNSITEDDAIAEGVDEIPVSVMKRNGTLTRRDDFAQLWEMINGKKHPWKSNPWVWVIEFRRVQP